MPVLDTGAGDGLFDAALAEDAVLVVVVLLPGLWVRFAAFVELAPGACGLGGPFTTGALWPEPVAGRDPTGPASPAGVPVGTDTGVAPGGFTGPVPVLAGAAKLLVGTRFGAGGAPGLGCPLVCTAGGALAGLACTLPDWLCVVRSAATS